MVFRKDREDGYGGVFLACTRDFAWQDLALQTSCEAVACKTALINHQSLIIISIYRPPNSDSQYFESICSLIHDIMLENPKSIVWIGGDFNLPNINWIDNSISNNAYPLSLCNLLLDTFDTFGFQQLVTFPTRRHNTLVTMIFLQLTDLLW